MINDKVSDYNCSNSTLHKKITIIESSQRIVFRSFGKFGIDRSICKCEFNCSCAISEAPKDEIHCQVPLTYEREGS